MDEFQQNLRESREAAQSWETRASQARLALTDAQRVVNELEGDKASAIARVRTVSIAFVIAKASSVQNCYMVSTVYSEYGFEFTCCQALEYEKTLAVLDREVTERRRQAQSAGDELAAAREQCEFNAHECTSLRAALDDAQRDCKQMAEERLALGRRLEAQALELQAATEKLRRLEPECARLAAAERDAVTGLQALQRRLAETQEAQRRSTEERKALELEFQSLILKCTRLTLLSSF